MSWLEAIPSQAAALEERPQFNVPPFPWKEFEEGLKNTFKLDCQISHKSKGWVTWEEPREGFYLPIFVSSINVPIFGFITKENLLGLIELFTSTNESLYFLEKNVSEAFFHFVALEVLKVIDHLHFADHLSFYIGDLPLKFKETLKEGSVYAIDISLKAKEKNISSHLLIPSSFRTLLKREFPTKMPFALSEDLKEKVAVDIGVEVGYTNLHLEELKQLRLGDFLILDHCSIDLDTKEGTVIGTLDKKSIFKGKLTQNGINIVEFKELEGEREKMENQEQFAFTEEGGTSQIPLDQIPIQLVVEVSRLKLSLEDLSSLSPGSLLELPVNIDEGVSLSVNGKEIGKGELVKIGDMMGVRIINI